MKTKFKLTKSSKVYLSIILVLILTTSVLSIVNTDISAYQAGKIFGNFLAFIIFPYFIAWITWMISGKKEDGGNLIFKLILTLMLISNTLKTINETRDYKNKKIDTYLTELKNSRNEFKQSILNDENKDESHKKYQSSVIKSIDKISKMSNKKEQKALSIFKRNLKIYSQETNKWDKAVDAIANDRILNIPLLKKEREFKYQKTIINNYIKASKKHKLLISNFVKNLEDDFNNNGINESSPFMKGFKKSINKKFSKKTPLFKVLMDEHIKYGKNMINLLNFLEKNNKLWEVKNETINFKDDNLSKTNTKLWEKLEINEDNINRFTKEIAKEF